MIGHVLKVYKVILILLLASFDVNAQSCQKYLNEIVDDLGEFVIPRSTYRKIRFVDQTNVKKKPY